MIGISLALSLAIILTQSSHPLCQHSLQQKSQENNISRMKALALTQISEFFSLPPLALFRSRIQVAFISQTARVSSAAAAPGTDFQSKLSPGESQHLSQPCSRQAPLLVPFCLWGFHSLPQKTPIQGDSYFPISRGKRTHLNAFKIKNTPSAFKDWYQLVLNLMHLLTLNIL